MMCLFSISDLILQLPCKIVRKMIYILGFISYIYKVFLCHVVFTQSTHVHDWRWFSQMCGIFTETLISRPCQDWGVDPNHHSFPNGTFIYLHDVHWFPCVFVCMAQHIDIQSLQVLCIPTDVHKKSSSKASHLCLFSLFISIA